MTTPARPTSAVIAGLRVIGPRRLSGSGRRVVNGDVWLAPDLPTAEPVPLGSMAAYSLCSMRNCAMAALWEGVCEDALFGITCRCG
jgi:hypothetical protein